MGAAEDAVLSAARVLLETSGLGPEDLLRHAAPDAVDQNRYPTLSDLTTGVLGRMKHNTARTYATHLHRLVEGTAAHCECLCDACCDVEMGCACAPNCSTCRVRRHIPAQAELRLVPGSVKKSDLEDYLVVTKWLARKKATAENRRRALEGRSAKPALGLGAQENAVAAYRALFQTLVDDEVWSTNPALRLKKPRRNKTRRRSLRDHELPELLNAVVTGGNDTELDFLLTWFHLESGARRQGALRMRMGGLDVSGGFVELWEKGDKIARQPISAELMRALLDHARSRAGDVCDPSSANFDPAAAVFYQRSGRPLTSRRYDTLNKRIQTSLPWANESMYSTHSLRKTGASLIERIAGRETARRFLRHEDRDQTDVYTASWEGRLALAIEVLTGQHHPATPTSTGEPHATPEPGSKG